MKPVKAKILIIDDEADLLETMKFRLESFGYKVFTATNGKDGIKSAELNQPDLIIMDVMMPEMNGFDALGALKKNEKTCCVPVIIFSCGKDEEEWAKKALKMGANGYIVKPFENDSLLFIVEKFIKK